MPRMTHNPDGQCLMTDRRLIFGRNFHRTKTLAVDIKGANLSLSAFPFFKGASKSSFSLKVIDDFASCLCACVFHCSQSGPFSVAGVCVFVCDFFNSVDG